MGEVVGAALVAHVPTIMLPEDPSGDQRRQRDHARARLHRMKSEKSSTGYTPIP